MQGDVPRTKDDAPVLVSGLVAPALCARGPRSPAWLDELPAPLTELSTDRSIAVGVGVDGSRFAFLAGALTLTGRPLPPCPVAVARPGVAEPHLVD
jgi:hypothetical protein